MRHKIDNEEILHELIPLFHMISIIDNSNITAIGYTITINGTTA